MRLPEQRLWDSMKRAAPPGVWLERIENMMSEGMPDVRCCARPSGIETWVELKVARLPVRHTSRVLGNNGCRVSQINWHLRQASFGGRSYVLIRDDARNLYLIPGSRCLDINNMTQGQLVSCSEADSWLSIFAVLETK